MNTVQRIAKNATVLLIGQIINTALAFFYTMYTARYLGAEGFGTLSFALAFSGIIGLVADLGLSSLTIREVARNKALADEYIGNISVIKVALAIITYLLIIAVCSLMGYPEQTLRVVQFISLSIIFNSFILMFDAVFQAIEKMEYCSIGKILSSFLLLSLTMIAIDKGLSVVGFAFIYFAVSVIGLSYSLLIYTWKLGLIKPEFDWLFLKPTLIAALPFLLSAIVDMIAFKIDIVMLSSMKGDAVVGWYSASYRLLEGLMFIPGAIGGSLYPVFSRFHISSKELLKVAYRKSFEYLTIISLPIAVGITILAERIIILIYGINYEPSIIALRLLIWTIPVIFLSHLMGTTLASINRQSLAVRITFMGMLLNILINLILIPTYSLNGASIATIVTSMSTLSIGFFFVSKFVCPLSLREFLLKLCIANIIMGAFLLIFTNENLALIIIISGLIYFIILYYLKLFSEEDYIIAQNILPILKRGGKNGYFR